MGGDEACEALGGGRGAPTARRRGWRRGRSSWCDGRTTRPIPSAGAWGLPAVTLRDGEDERGAVVRAGRVKLGVELAPGRRIGEKTADRGGYLLRLADYEAEIVSGVPWVPQPDASMTQYTACRFTADPAVLAEAAARGSVCAQVFLEDLGENRLDPA